VNIPYFIASRYIFSKKKHNVINVISLVSVIGVAVVTMALVIVLSAFNGMHDMVSESVGPFSADIKISPKEGKHFISDSTVIDNLRKIEGVSYFTEVIEESSLVKYGKRQRPILLKAVSDDYFLKRGLVDKIVEGDSLLRGDGFQYIILGYGVARELGVGLSFVTPLDFYFPKRGKNDISNPLSSLNLSHAFPSGIFFIDATVNSKYVYTSIPFARKLFDLKYKCSYYEIDVKDSFDIEGVKEKIFDIVGDSYKVQNRYEQNETMYKVFKSEKAVTFLILAFILLIASFNIVGSLTMLILDKKDDIATLAYLGMQKKDLEKIFSNQGWIISVVGCFIGLVLGVIVVLIQQNFGIITTGAGLISLPYPVKLQGLDLLIVTGTVLLIGYIAARYPVRYLINRLT